MDLGGLVLTVGFSCDWLVPSRFPLTLTKGLHVEENMQFGATRGKIRANCQSMEHPHLQILKKESYFTLICGCHKEHPMPQEASIPFLSLSCIHVEMCCKTVEHQKHGIHSEIMRRITERLTACLSAFWRPLNHFSLHSAPPTTSPLEY